jgi:dephospho-CoA kinase
MALYFVTGTAGTGKSQVCCKLNEKGYESYDIDDGLARWRQNQTGYIYPKSSVKAHQRTAEFLTEHSWIVPRQSVVELMRKASDKPVFLCGSLANEDELRDLFARVCVLYVDDQTLEQRLTTRTTNDWGKQPHELKQTLLHHHQSYERYQQQGDYIIDASQPLDRVVDEVLAATLGSPAKPVANNILKYPGADKHQHKQHDSH